MVNGNYVLYGDRPSSESEIVDDHVQTRTAERKNKRKSSRNANELQRTLNMAQLDNETDSIKYEKTVKEPRLLRYVATTDVEENYVTEKFETYDLKPTEERPRRYAFQKKPRNPTDGSVNYAYSRSSSSCSSPNGNLPTISEHGEQYGTYRVQNLQSPKEDIINGYENKLDKYFYKPKEMKKFSSKVNFEGSHPDSLYRVAPSSGVGVDKMAKILRIMRWPLALVLVCVALAAFVYFLMPENKYNDMDVINGTYWEPMTAGAHTHENLRAHGPPRPKHRTHTKKPEPTQTHNLGTKTSEIDFYDVENDKNAGFTTMIDSITESSKNRILPIKPVFPTHIAPEVQYGNERADADKLRTPKVLEEASSSPDATLKPHITQKPEKPLAVYFKDLNGATTSPTETFTTAETVNENASYDEKTINTYVNYGDKQIIPIRNYGDKSTTKKVEISTKSHPAVYKDYRVPVLKAKPLNIKQYLVTEPEIPLEIEEYYGPPLKLDNFTSGHSKLFGISIEDAEKMKSTTQSSLYNTRVSPTLPTWRDGDDTTTKKYPINVNYEVPLCRSTRLPLCSEILPYDLAGSPATIAGVEVTSLMSQIGYLVATNCSERVRHFTCALLEPECNPPPYPPKMPCYNLCKAIVDGCEGVIPRELAPAFNCQQYSRTNCVAAKTPCFAREMTCGDGTCIPRDWICDGSQDCPDGEDEATCNFCQRNEYRCKSGGCILRRWLCDGYADCPGGEDETEACEHREVGEPGEESAGSAPAPVVRRPSRVTVARGGDMRKAGENDNSKELLVTSDSSNAFKRNFTRRPSLSRLSPYTRSTQAPVNVKPDSQEFDFPKKTERKNQESIESTQKPQDNDYVEEVNIGELGFFEELKKARKQPVASNNEQNPPTRQKAAEGMARAVASNPTRTTKLDKSINKLEKVINGAALLRKAQAEEQDMDSPETNGTTIEANDFIPANVPETAGSGKRNPDITSAHVSPCPSGELRCVDGRCITLAQLCDGTIDCSDHADEDNCYT